VAVHFKKSSKPVKIPVLEMTVIPVLKFLIMIPLLVSLLYADGWVYAANNGPDTIYVYYPLYRQLGVDTFAWIRMGNDTYIMGFDYSMASDVSKSFNDRKFCLYYNARTHWQADGNTITWEPIVPSSLLDEAYFVIYALMNPRLPGYPKH